MDKINKLPDKPQKRPTRFVILPLKPHLAKFIKVDWDRIWPLIPREETEKYIKSLSNARKLGKYKFERIYSDESMREDRICHIIDMYFMMLLDGIEPLVNDYDDLTIEWYKSRKNLPPELKQFVLTGYSLVKITFPIKRVNKYKRKTGDYNSSIFLNTYAKRIRSINESLNSFFYDYINSKCFYHKTIDAAIEEVKAITGINESHIKTATLKRKLHSSREDHRLRSRDLFEERHLHKRIWDKELVEIYQDHIQNDISYSQLAAKYNHSKTTIARVCKNPKVIALYHDINRYHDTFFDWLLKK
ncbi:hypothetical protein [Mangrovibacterium sp.]|uniref:hypothetical protein n=1 Tax=Mangrovibacterium sp. TaxID=1961364 RepID=UPI0035693326